MRVTMVLPALTEATSPLFRPIDRLPGRHLFGNRRFAEALFAGMSGAGRVWQAAGTVDSVLAPGLLEQAAQAGLRSLFVGFETVNDENLASQHKRQNIGRDYSAVVRRLHDLGVMVNASFVFGMDGDRPDVFDRTVSWAVDQGIETATFHIMTPYPGTGLYTWMAAQGRMLHSDWDRYDTRHVVFRPLGMTSRQLEDGYWRAYRDFYRWGLIFRGAWGKPVVRDRLRHIAYAGGWKKFEPLWDLLIRTGQVLHALPLLESLLGSFGARTSGSAGREEQLEVTGGGAPAAGGVAAGPPLADHGLVRGVVVVRNNGQAVTTEGLGGCRADGEGGEAGDDERQNEKGASEHGGFPSDVAGRGRIIVATTPRLRQ